MTDGINEKIEVSDPILTDKHEDDKLRPFINLSGSFSQTSRIHRRSFKDTLISGNVLWEDEYKNKFMEVNVKGRPPKKEFPFLELDEYSSRGVRTHWMCDSTDVERTDQVSKILRQNNLPTERIRRISKIKKVDINDQQIDVSEFKQRLLQNAYPINGRKDVWTDYIKHIDFYEVERDVPVGERITDLVIASDTSKKAVIEILKPTFKYLKLVEGLNLDLEKDDDIKEFITKILPERMGKYLGKFHNLGLKHSYPGGKNWILIGALVDLDSVVGIPLGQKLPTNDEIGEDLNQSLQGLCTLFNLYGTSTYGFIWSLWNDDGEKMKEVSDDTLKVFLDSYKETRNVGNDFIIGHINPLNIDINDISRII